MFGVSYPIARIFTSIAIGLLLLAQATEAHANEALKASFTDAQGKTLSLNDFKEKPVIINLWASWCAPCVQEMPSLAKLQQDYADKGLVVIALSEDDSINTALDFYKKNGITGLTPYFDKGREVWSSLKARGMPTTVLINRKGDTVQRIEGPVDWQSPKIQALVAEITAP